MANGRITAQGTYADLLAAGVDFHAALQDDAAIGAATPSPGLSPMHRSPAKGAALFPTVEQVLSMAAEAAAATPPLVAVVSEPGTPVSQSAATEYTDVTALLLGDSMEPLSGAPGGAR